MVQNLVTGVTDGFTKVLEITGVGYRATAQGATLKLQLGYSHDVNYVVPEGITIKTPDQTTVEISGNDKRSEEHTSELQSLMRISYAVFCLKKKKTTKNQRDRTRHTKNI